MPESHELAAQKNADRIEAKRQKRLQDFESGLNQLTRLDIDRIDKPITKDQYESDCYADLRQVMARAELTRGGSKVSRVVDED